MILKPGKYYLNLAFYIFIPLFLGFIGSLFTAPAITGWYSYLNKPFFNPPSWLFAPVWTLLYIMMGYSAFIVSLYKPEVNLNALKLYWLQLIFNFLWSLIFFGLKDPLLALVDITILLYLIFITRLEFNKISKPAGNLLIPYILWVSFASILNLSLIILN